jgi:hypothetical protein
MWLILFCVWLILIISVRFFLIAYEATKQLFSIVSYLIMLTHEKVFLILFVC